MYLAKFFNVSNDIRLVCDQRLLIKMFKLDDGHGLIISKGADK